MAFQSKSYEEAKAKFKPLRRKPRVNKGLGLKRKSGMKQGKPIKAKLGLSLKDKVWNQFSIYIRRRDAADGHVCCVTCWIEIPWKEAHAGHFVPGRNNSTLFDERNCHAQCFRCNITLCGNPGAYEDFMLKRYGRKVVSELRALRNETRKWQAEELKDLLYRYKSLNSE
jgi:hypothetical protein